MALSSLGYLLLARGEDDAAAPLLAESRAIFRELRALGDRDFFALHQLAEIARLQGDPAEARALAIASLAAQREMGHRHLVVHALDRLAALARAEGDYGQARALLAEGLELAREVGAQPWIGRVLISLAKLSQAEADYPQARAVFRQSLGIARAIGDRGAMANCIGGLGLVATQQGAWLEGVRLIGAARQLDELYPSPFDPTERAQFRECLDLARSALGGEAFSRAWAAGQAMTLTQTLACAVEGDRD
jgi:tetratricopeptide (TPR) repeat protein